MPCQFCRLIAEADYCEANDDAVALADAYPVARGHTLIVPRMSLKRRGETAPYSHL